MAALFRKSGWEAVGGFSEDMKMGREDWEFWISILKSGGRVKRVDAICFFYRVKSFSMAKDLDVNKTEFLKTISAFYLSKR